MFLFGRDDKNRLVAEYIVTNNERFFVFTVFGDEKVIGSFKYKISNNSENKTLPNTYKNFLKTYNLKTFNNADLIISTFDTSASDLKVKSSSINLTGSDKIVENFMIDNYGKDYKSNYFIRIHRSTVQGGLTLRTFFICPMIRIKESESMLSELGIRKFRVSFMGQYLDKLFKRRYKFNSTFCVYENDNYTILLPVKNRQVINTVFIYETDANKAKKQPLGNINNLIASLNHQYFIDGEYFDGIQIFGSKRNAQTLLEFTHNVNYGGDVTDAELLAKPINAPYSPIVKDKVIKNKPKFDWRKFLGLKSSAKKGFTLVESVVSIAIFSIVAALTSTFLMSAINTNLDTKRRALAISYMKSFSEIFQEDPSEDSIRSLTTYIGDDFIGNRHSYYLDRQMEFDKPSSSPQDMTYQVVFEYSSFSYDTSIEGVYQDYTKYTFTFVSIHIINKTKSYTDQTTFTAVK